MSARQKHCSECGERLHKFHDRTTGAVEWYCPDCTTVGLPAQAEESPAARVAAGLAIVTPNVRKAA
jgi:uncharacterized Zn finger protein (UPF0148 family)